MSTEVRIINILEKAVILGVISISWSFICYLLILAYQQKEWFAVGTLFLGLASVLFVFVQGMVDIVEMYSDDLSKKYGGLKSGLVCIGIAYIALLPPAYTLLSIFKS